MRLNKPTVARWVEHGLVTGYAYNAHYYLYERPYRNPRSCRRSSMQVVCFMDVSSLFSISQLCARPAGQSLTFYDCDAGVLPIRDAGMQHHWPRCQIKNLLMGSRSLVGSSVVDGGIFNACIVESALAGRACKCCEPSQELAGVVAGHSEGYVGTSHARILLRK